MIAQFCSRLVLSALCFAFASCTLTLGHRDMAIVVPQGNYPATKGAVSIGSVTDARNFEEWSYDPSVPTVSGDLKSLSPQERNRYIGRQSSGFSKSGDVRLPEGGTVTGKATELVAEGLARRGYKTGAGGVPVQITVLKFWAWSAPDTWTFTIRAQVRCRVTVKGHTFEVQGSAANSPPGPTTKNWQEVYNDAFEDFIKQLESQLSVAGL